MTDLLGDHLAAVARRSRRHAAAAETIAALCAGAVSLHAAIARGAAAEGDLPLEDNPSGEAQKPLDVFADELFLAVAAAAPILFYGSEERDAAVAIGGGDIALAIDPLDGSSNIGTNVPVGTIFSLLPAGPEHRDRPEAIFGQPGRAQIASGFFVYGAQLLLVMTCGEGTWSFAHDPATGVFGRGTRCVVPHRAGEYSVNAANRRHWRPELRSYLEEVDLGRDGPRRRDFGMRYAGSLVADGFRILQRGGIFLYPGDARDGYGGGRLRQVYEANPVAFCIEQAGGAATDGAAPMLDRRTGGLHDRVPLIFGSREEVEIVTRFLDPAAARHAAPPPQENRHAG